MKKNIAKVLIYLIPALIPLINLGISEIVRYADVLDKLNWLYWPTAEIYWIFCIAFILLSIKIKLNFWFLSLSFLLSSIPSFVLVYLIEQYSGLILIGFLYDLMHTFTVAIITCIIALIIRYRKGRQTRHIA